MNAIEKLKKAVYNLKSHLSEHPTVKKDETLINEAIAELEAERAKLRALVDSWRTYGTDIAKWCAETIEAIIGKE